MNDTEFKILVAVAKLPKPRLESALLEADAMMHSSAKRLKGLSRDVLRGLRDGGCSGSAASMWLNEVCREAGRNQPMSIPS